VGVARGDASTILGFTGGSSGVADLDQTLGWSFTVSTTVSVDALGFFDVGANGLSGDHIVALWSSGGGAPRLRRSTARPAGLPLNTTRSAFLD